MAAFITSWIEFFIFFYFLVLNSFYCLLYLLSIPIIYRRSQEAKTKEINRLVDLNIAPPITVIVPIFNEMHMIRSTISSLLNVNYSNKEIILINDGSTDETLQELTHGLQLVDVPIAAPWKIKTEPVKAVYRSSKYPHILVIDKINGGREDALNAGLNLATSPLCLLIDADCILQPDICQRMIIPLLSSPHTLAIGTTLRILNSATIKNGRIVNARFPHAYWIVMQTIEYMRTFLFGRIGWSELGGQYLISGGCGLFKRDLLMEVGGFRNVLAGDLDITLRLHGLQQEQKKTYSIDYIPDAVAWTHVPASYQSLRKQRERWYRSIISCCIHLRYMLFNPKYGRVGFVHLPYLIFGELLGAIVEAFGYCYIILSACFGFLNFSFIWYFLLVAWGLIVILNFFSFLMEYLFFKKKLLFFDTLKMLWFSLIENIGYRQFTVWWRLQGLFNYFTKKRSTRERVERNDAVSK